MKTITGNFGTHCSNPLLLVNSFLLLTAVKMYFTSNIILLKTGIFLANFGMQTEKIDHIIKEKELKILPCVRPGFRASPGKQSADI